MFVKRSSLVLASLMALPSAAFALGFGDLRLLSPLNAPLDAEIELVDVAPEDMQSLKAQIASRETFTRYGLEWPVFLSTVQVKITRTADGRQVLKLKSTDTITEPFITLLVEVSWARGRSSGPQAQVHRHDYRAVHHASRGGELGSWTFGP